MSRRWVGWGAWCVVVLMTAPALAADTAPPPALPFEGQVSRAEANVRADSNVANEVLATLPRGSRVSVIGEHAGWYRIRLPKTARCYIAAQYVDGKGVITGEHVNVRAGAGRQFTILGQLPRGEHVRVLEKQGEWARVEPAPGLSGWIRADLVTPMAMSASADVAQASAESSGLAPTTVAALASDAAAVTSLPPTATGIVETTRGFRRPGKYRLTRDGQTLFYLHSDRVDLAQYKHQHVAVWGAMDATRRAPHPLVIVQRVERAD